MKKTLIAIAAAATLATGTLAVPQPAQARCLGCWIGAGVLGGLIIGSAIAHGPYHGPGYYYGPGPAYYGPGCYWTHRRWWDGGRWHRRRVRVCY
jgi:hypothetical protein